MTIEQIEQRIDALKSEQDKLAAELERLKIEKSEVKPWRAEKGEDYYAINDQGNSLRYHEIYDEFNDKIFAFGNYYRTRELAVQDSNDLALRGHIRQLRDALCEGYRFNPLEENYYIQYSHTADYFYVECAKTDVSIAEIFFDTLEHAQQVCDILNKGG